MFTTLLHPPLAGIALALAVLGQPAAAATFTVGVGSTLGNSIRGCIGAPISGPGPVSISGGCSDIDGVLSATASSNSGHLGASATAVSFRIGGDLGGQAIFSDTLTFTSSNPLATFADVSLNMVLDGVLTSAANASNGSFGGTLLDGHIAIAGGFYQFLFSNNTDRPFLIAKNAFGLTAGVIGPTTNAQLRTPTFRVDFNAPVNFEMSISSGAFASGSGGSSTTDFSGSFKFPTVGDVFNLPNGVTVNAGDYLVNNHFIDPLAVSVPEPASWALMIAGLGMAGVALRRRRGR